MNSQTSLNKENVNIEPALPSKSLDKPREFGRDVTNNTFAENNKDWFVSKDSTNTTDSDSHLKNTSEEADAKEAKVNVPSVHPFAKEVMGATQGQKREETLSSQVSLRAPKGGERSGAVEN